MQIQIVKKPKTPRTIYYFYDAGILFGEKCAPSPKGSATNSHVGSGKTLSYYLLLLLSFLLETNVKEIFSTCREHDLIM